MHIFLKIRRALALVSITLVAGLLGPMLPPLSRTQAITTREAHAGLHKANKTPSLVICPDPNAGTPLQGVDVSVYNGTVDWTAVKNSEKSFGYARIADGMFMDTTFQTNFTAMKSAGIKPGAYFFFEPGQDPIAQANSLLTALTQAGFTVGDLLPAIDIEVTGGQQPATVAAHLQTMVNIIQQALVLQRDFFGVYWKEAHSWR